MKRIPAHIGWPLTIIALLLSNIGIAVGTLFFANAGGGVQVMPDYYAQAVAWDSLSTAKLNAATLGWNATASADRESGVIEMTITDKNLQPIVGLEPIVAIYRPHISRPIATVRLEHSSTPGRYTGNTEALQGKGLYDFALTASQEDLIFIETKRLDLR
ncbi:MAG: hypothetical protein HKN13_02840 [Rhodothermales bacterium]|nr:hypothetical protein [Rhodothermales bacterium]